MTKKKMGKKVVIVGVSGFIGRRLAAHLLKNGYTVVGTSRHPERLAASLESTVRRFRWDGYSAAEVVPQLEGALAVVNLAGEPIAAGRWTRARKARILNSRVRATRALSEAVAQTEQKPRVLIQASAVGFYGCGNGQILVESSPRGSGFLAEVVEQWESAAAGVETAGVRLVRLRIAMVLGRGGGALPRLTLPFRLFLGGQLGTGEQWMSWIHLHDLLAAISFLIEREGCRGIFNAAAPEPLRNRDFASTVGRAMGRPSWFRVPAFVLRLALGEAANEMLLISQRVVSRQLPAAGFAFRFPRLLDALTDLLKK
jgi:uncharacterized protein (TIGR01777 family)